MKCEICKSTESREWHTCIVCGATLCEECGVKCDNCGKFYCLDRDCGDDYIDEVTNYHFCYKCK